MIKKKKVKRIKLDLEEWKGTGLAFPLWRAWHGILMLFLREKNGAS